MRSRFSMLLRHLLLLMPAVVLAAAPDGAGAQDHAPVRLFQIGLPDGSPEYTFGTVADLAFGHGDTFYLLDAANSVVRSYDLEGRHLRSFGRSGSGPGELRFPTKLLVSPTELLVLDPQQQRLVRYSMGGQHIQTSRAEAGPLSATLVIPLRHNLWLGASTGMRIDGALISRVRGQGAAYIARNARDIRRATEHTIVAWQEGAASPDTIFRYDHGMIISIMEAGAVGLVPRTWGPGGGWSTSGDSLVAVVSGMTGEIRILQATPAGLRPLRSLRASITPQPLTERDWRSAEQAALDQNRRRPADHLVGPPFRPQVGQPIFSDDGNLWVQRLDIDPANAGVDDRPGNWVIIPLDGRAQSVVQVPRGFNLQTVRGDLLLGTRRTELGYSLVELWRMQARGPPAPGRAGQPRRTAGCRIVASQYPGELYCAVLTSP